MSARRKGLGQRLWDTLEAAQGHSFVSDDMCYWPDGQVLAFVHANLANVRKVARVFGQINRQYKFVSGGDRPASEADRP